MRKTLECIERLVLRSSRPDWTLEALSCLLAGACVVMLQLTLGPEAGRLFTPTSMPPEPRKALRVPRLMTRASMRRKHTAERPIRNKLGWWIDRCERISL